MIEVGHKFYFIVHAYYHVVGEVVAITGKRECVLRNAVLVHSCQRDWTSFFKNGFKSDTQYNVLPDGTGVSGWIIEIPWAHEIPRTK